MQPREQAFAEGLPSRESFIGRHLASSGKGKSMQLEAFLSLQDEEELVLGAVYSLESGHAQDKVNMPQFR